MESVAKRPGRPQKYKGANLTRLFQFRCFQQDIDAFHRKAKSLGKKAGDWAREILKREAGE